MRKVFGFLLSLIVLLTIVGCFFLLPKTPSHGATGDCTLVVPANPLTAVGLATPYQLLAPCHESDPATQAFVQGAILNTDTGAISIYNPLVIDQGTTPAIMPAAPTLPANNIVALWFGFNGNVLTLQGNGVQQGNCFQGMVQFAYCHAQAFFAEVNMLGKTKIPALGMGNDGKPCPTVRDFSIVDQDQSDNTPVSYLLTADGRTAQDTAANRTALGNTLAKNPSDEWLLTLVDKALGCTPFMAPDLADGGNMVPALPLNELQAAAMQQAPMALVPAGDPFVGPNNQLLLNRYRSGVDQPLAGLNNASTTTYCQNLRAIAPARLNLDEPWTVVAASPTPDVATNLFTFLAQRFSFTFGPDGLNCTGLLGIANPVTLTQDAAGVVTAATIAM